MNSSLYQFCSTFNVSILTLLFGLILPSVFEIGSVAHAQAEQKTAPELQPQTIEDVDIPIEHLKFLTKPMTKEELVVEAEAWRDILKEKLVEIAKKRIESKKQRQTEEEGNPDAEAEVDTKLEALLPDLLESKTDLIDRFQVILDELELKGGETESFRLYVDAQSGVSVDVTDSKETWTLIKGWMKSEEGGKKWGWNLVRFMTILIAFFFGASIVANIIRHAVSRVRGTSQLLVNFSGRFVRQILMVIGAIVALTALEVDITPLLAAVGAAGFVVGFALQDTLSNFASGILILGYRPFDVGDVIEAADVSGIVDSVSLFSTHVRTFDNKLMIVPNNQIWGGTITNSTASQTRRVDMTFEICPSGDIDKALNVLGQVVSNHEQVLDDPAPLLRMHDTNETAITLICRPWTKTENYWTVYWDITREVRKEFERNSISLPIPRRVIEIQNSQESTV